MGQIRTGTGCTLNAFSLPNWNTTAHQNVLVPEVGLEPTKSLRSERSAFSSLTTRALVHEAGFEPALPLGQLVLQTSAAKPYPTSHAKLAERVRFELTTPVGVTVFGTVGINRTRPPLGMAEKVGFEPTAPFGYGSLANCWVKPLPHSSDSNCQRSELGPPGRIRTCTGLLLRQLHLPVVLRADAIEL